MRIIVLLIATILFFTFQSEAQNFSPAIQIGTQLRMNGGGWREDTLDSAAATNRIAFGFLAPISCTLDEVCVAVLTKTGTLAATDGVIAIYSSALGVPNASLSSGTFDPSTVGFKCSTQNQAVVANTQYWFNITNANGTPASNNFSILQAKIGVVAGATMGTLTGSEGLGSQAMKSINNGSTWGAGAGQRAGAAIYRAHCSSGEYFGFPATNGEQPTFTVNAADRVYAAREVGNKITIPAGMPTMNLKCVEIDVGRIGTPTGELYYRLYQGDTFVADTGALKSGADLTTQSAGIKLCFASSQDLVASTTYRVVAAESTQSDVDSNSFGPHRIDFHNAAASLALKPFWGTATKAVCAGSCNGGTWVDTTTSFYMMNLYLDETTPFDAAVGGGGGGGQKSNLNGGLN